MRHESLSLWCRPFEKLKKKMYVALDCPWLWAAVYNRTNTVYTFPGLLPNISCATCSESVQLPPKIDNDIWRYPAVGHLRGNIAHRRPFHYFHCDCFCSDIEGVQNKVICLWSETTYSVNVASTCRLRVGFTYRLKPRASRSKGALPKLWYAYMQWPVCDHLD